MKNVKNAHFWQIDHEVKRIASKKGVILLTSPEAWHKFLWSRAFFKEKPKEGYFVWFKATVTSPWASCVSIASTGVKQDLNNLIVVEEGLKVATKVECLAIKHNLKAEHKTKGKIVLRKGATLEYDHIHNWGSEDIIATTYEFILENKARLIYNYQSLLPPQKLDIKNIVYGAKDTSTRINFLLNGLNTKVKITDKLYLNGEKAQGIVNLRLVGRKKSEITAIGEIIAKKESKGHLDCQGLLVGEQAKILVSPKLHCRHKEAQLTHEAAIGRIAEEPLTYLRMRGLSETEAINLIISGFLKI